MGESGLQELQQKLNQKTGSFKMVLQQSRAAHSAQNRARLTLKEVQGLDNSTECFEAVGRAYFLKPKMELQQQLEEAEATAGKQMAELAESRDKLQKDVQAVEREIRELIAAEPKLAAQFLAQ